ncbi:lysophospholipid acyltransferase family protein [Litoribrevibacter albus]|uniref:1-acyl-sn-glycerol-3-phosphate acyltransferase n=1 Tax=Litoribrevibacter albus TaxID=1473156 RepID=A0AA37W652_9GAMM|nr:lysophospholipid acyltransferase family protein [Litoribrevibacter albus]GLQ31782.1 1-acyl-sn-glycerol-3-phosphate acyltransferase [Litoribrevibacter albus]
MRRTIYTTPVVRQIFWVLSWIGIKLSGWKLVGTPPKEKKFVLVAVPHTSNWDFPITLAMAFLFGFRLNWMGKHTLFKGPMGPIMKWLGGIPVDRRQKNNLVEQIVLGLNQLDECALAIPPEGTRSRTEKWKTGFYYIAQGADIPIGLAFLDYKQKRGGFGPTFYLTGDVDRDIAEMQAFYKGISGKHEDQCANE